jgi:NAD-dependent dihydropyrimidine dehydrogenase PreA subunit
MERRRKLRMSDIASSSATDVICKFDAGVLQPVIDRNRCEAKGPCVEVCPYDVLDVRPLSDEERRALSLMGKLKAWTHGGRQAYAAQPEACHGCGLCVTACPEDAITLKRAAPRS